MHNLSDEQLVAKYLKGDEEALEILIKRYLKPIYSFVYKNIGDGEVAEDITQEVFVKMWRNIRKFKRQKSFKTWIFTIAKNTSIDFLKKKKAIPFCHFENEKGENIIAETLADSSPLPDALFERAGLVKTVQAAINQLALKYRFVLFLRYNNHTFREIAEALGEPLNTVKSRHRRAISALKDIIS